MPLRQYLLSLPERVLRSASALAGGLLREIGEVALPPRVRRTQLYQSLVDSTLRFLIEQVGQVPGVFPTQEQLARDFLVRRAAGNGIEWAGLLAFHASPVWVLAALADLCGAGRDLLREIAASLKQEGLLDPDATFDSLDQILDGLEATSGRLAETFNTPPLDVPSLRREWDDLRARARKIPPRNLPSPALVRRNWQALKTEAARQRRSVFELSSVMALAAVARLPDNLRWLSRCSSLAARRTGRLFASALLDHYTATLHDIRRTGYVRYWAREFRPYLAAAARQFSPKETKHAPGS